MKAVTFAGPIKQERDVSERARLLAMLTNTIAKPDLLGKEVVGRASLESLPPFIPESTTGATFSNTLGPTTSLAESAHICTKPQQTCRAAGPEAPKGLMTANQAFWDAFGGKKSSVQTQQHKQRTQQSASAQPDSNPETVDSQKAPPQAVASQRQSIRDQDARHPSPTLNFWNTFGGTIAKPAKSKDEEQNRLMLSARETSSRQRPFIGEKDLKGLHTIQYQRFMAQTSQQVMCPKFQLVCLTALPSITLTVMY